MNNQQPQEYALQQNADGEWVDAKVVEPPPAEIPVVVEFQKVTETWTPPPGFRLLTEREANQRRYPKTGTGLRQGERVARQVQNSGASRAPLSNYHPFAASNRCIAAIKARLEKRREKGA